MESLAERSPLAAADLLEEAFAAAESLETMSERGREVPEIRDGRTRELFVRHHRLRKPGSAQSGVAAPADRAHSGSVRIESREIIPRPLDEVYPLMRDHLDLVVRYLPNVQRIDRIEAERTEDDILEVVNHWFVIAEVPRVVRKVLTPELFSWKDYAQWNDADHSVSYRLESVLANDLYDAVGTNYFKAVGDNRTELHVTCELDIRAERIPGVPKFVLSKVMPIVETVIKQLVAPNLRSVGKAVAAYYRDPNRAKPAG